MADTAQLETIRSGVAAWNRWRSANPEVRPDLSSAGLGGMDLQGADLSESDLSGALLARSRLSGADLGGADLRGADLSEAQLDGVDFSRCTIDMFTNYEGVTGCDIGVNGLYSEATDSAALMRIDPPGNSMQGASAEAVLESLRHARKLHTFSLLLAGFALLFIVVKPKSVTLPYLAGSFRFDALSYSFLATILSTLLLSQVGSFLDSALDGARYLNDRRSAMLVGHFPWLLSKYESDPRNRKRSKLMRFFLAYHPVVYLYFFVQWDALLTGDWAALEAHYHELPVVLGELLLPAFYAALFFMCRSIFRMSERFQQPILFDTETERLRRSDMERLAEAVEHQARQTAELVGMIREREENRSAGRP
jgi:uncharacterized integral membrane protein